MHLQSQHAIDAWTATFLQHPMLFHTFHYTCAVHQDLVSSSLSRSFRPEILAHKGQALQHLSQLLGARIDHAGMELAIHTMGLLATHDLDQTSFDAMYSAHPLPFDPTMPPPHSLRVFSRIAVAQAHQDAMHIMIHRIGGLQNLKLPGMADTIALCVATCLPGQRNCSSPR